MFISLNFVHLTFWDVKGAEGGEVFMKILSKSTL